MRETNWKIEGCRGEAIHGTTHEVEGEATCNLVIAHGFKGYKDYGLFPWLANKAAEAGAITHRFNFSHSGMLAGDGPFERADLFEADSWNTQVNDLKAVIANCSCELPTILLGHSRGGVAILLAAGRGVINVDRLIPISAPSTCNPLSKEMQQAMLRDGFLESPSSRTDQKLRIGRVFLDEQIADPEQHDLLALVANIEVPISVIHGEDDETVLVSSGEAIAKVAKNATFRSIHGGNHVFNTPNPFPIDGTPSHQLAGVWSVVLDVIRS
jgi:alpha-beta hydrolase superfamily lysophospholipase